MANDAVTPGSDATRVRIDKWLWAARFFRTRALACAAIDAGHVRMGGERVKAAKAIHPGDRIAIFRDGLCWDVEVAALSERRGGAVDAAKLYRETDESLAARQCEVARRRADSELRLPGRPTKRNRRRLEDFLAEP
jgi:ribosome-associated heat shock protein Hsp15